MPDSSRPTASFRPASRRIETERTTNRQNFSYEVSHQRGQVTAAESFRVAVRLAPQCQGYQMMAARSQAASAGVVAVNGNVAN